ncbi:MAG: DUF2298 domain-containing protein [Candidatus Sumerlaea chitinivorans]|nr:DUF2298 domain-containing protein [Candidatus Sumerlaea chitinivorans]
MDLLRQIVFMTQVVISALPWYGAMQLIAFVAYPLLFGVFGRLPDRGYAAAKSVGLVLVAYLVFVAAHVPTLGFEQRTVLASIIFVAIFSVFTLPHTGPYLIEFFRLRWRLCLVEELLFGGGFVAMVLLRAQVPQITYVISDFAAEKFTDFAVLNAVLCSPTFPPHDGWLSGFTLNYYYWGHFMWAMLTRFVNLAPEIGFNLGLASICGYLVLLSFSLGYNLTAKKRWGFFAVFLIVFASNIDGFLQLFGIAWEILGREIPAHRWYLGYDFWRSSRAIKNTINEFPAFSLILGDLHAHLSALVIFLSGLLLSLQILRGIRRSRSLLHYEFENPDELFFAALIFGALYAANSWDVVTFAAVTTMTLWIGGISSVRCVESESGERRAISTLWRLLRGIEAILLTGILAFVGIRLLFYPYWRHFHPPNVYLAWVPSEIRTSTIEFFVHWGLLGVFPATLAVLLARRKLASRTFLGWAEAMPLERWVAVGVLAAAGIAVAITSDVGFLPALLLVATIGTFVLLLQANLNPGLRFLWGLVGLFLALATFCEFVYLDDIFTGPIERINTVFKIYYGLWPILALASVAAAARLSRYARSRRAKSRVLWTVVAIVCIGGVYPISGVLQRVAMSSPQPPPRSPLRALDGMRYLMRLHPDDYACILWLRAFTDPEARILEAPGKQYEYAGRMSTNSGRPALGGWLYHEWGWRGEEFAPERDRRFSVAQRIYESPNLRETLELLKQERIRYVIVGDTERERYPALVEQKFLIVGKHVYSYGRTTIYEIPSDVSLPPDLEEALVVRPPKDELTSAPDQGAPLSSEALDLTSTTVTRTESEVESVTTTTELSELTTSTLPSVSGQPPTDADVSTTQTLVEVGVTTATF